MGKDYGSWSIADLKDELRKRNAKLGGKKAALVQRLEDYDKLFGPLRTEPESVFKILVPSPENFRDVTSNSSIPNLTADDLDMFSQLTGRDNIETSRNMYRQNYLKSCRVAASHSEYFVTGMVSSEMRKNITYNVTIKARDHLILEAQCECAAGLGPYAQCKHILVIMFALIDMKANNTMILEQSATTQLQTFHQPRRLHTGDPVKAEEVTLKFEDKKYKELLSFDPRPAAESPEQFQNSIKQAISNYCGHGQSNNMAIAQIFKPADKACVDHEHDYNEKTQAEIFLESLNLNEEKRQELEKATRDNKKVWKRERIMRLPSSQFGNICQCGTDSSKKNLVRTLLKNNDISAPAIKHGIKYESQAIRRFENMTNIKTEKCGILVHPDYPFLASTPDRLVKEDSVLEVKCPYTARNSDVSPETVPYLYLCEKTGSYKLSEKHIYYYQVQGQLMCTGRRVGYFCVYTLKDFKIITVNRNDSFIEDMLSKLRDFYHNYFKVRLIEKFVYNKK